MGGSIIFIAVVIIASFSERLLPEYYRQVTCSKCFNNNEQQAMGALSSIVSSITYSLSIVTCPFYILLMFVIIRYRKCAELKQSLYTLLQICGVFDLMYMFWSFLMLRMPNFLTSGGWWSSYLIRSSPYYLPIVEYMRGNCSNVGHTLLVIMAYNRYDGIVNPIKYKTVGNSVVFF